MKSDTNTILKFIISLSIFMSYIYSQDTLAQAIPEKAPATLPPEKLDAVLVIKTDKASGTGFIVSYKKNTYIVTNQHVIDGATTVTISDNKDRKYKPSAFIGAVDADIVMMKIDVKNPFSKYFEFADDPVSIAKNGDEVIIPGNSRGEGVITVTPGKLLNFGPTRVEVSNPIYAGNSGGPIYHVASGKVIGICTEASRIPLDAFDKESFKEKDSQIKKTIRYFGHRVDTAQKWKSFNWKQYQTHSKFLKNALWEQEMVLNWMYGEDFNFQKFKALDEAVNSAAVTVGARTRSDADKIKALEGLNRTLENFMTRRLTHLESSTNPHPAPLYIQAKTISRMKVLASYVKNESEIANRDMDYLKKALQNDGQNKD